MDEKPPPYMEATAQIGWWTPGMALPAGWEALKNAGGKWFFVNHNDKSTQFEPPPQSLTPSAPSEVITPVNMAVEHNAAGAVTHMSFDNHHAKRQLHYCGRTVYQDGYENACGSCDGRCGPIEGCQCKDCYKLDNVNSAFATTPPNPYLLPTFQAGVGAPPPPHGSAPFFTQDHMTPLVPMAPVITVQPVLPHMCLGNNDLYMPHRPNYFREFICCCYFCTDVRTHRILKSTDKEVMMGNMVLRLPIQGTEAFSYSKEMLGIQDKKKYSGKNVYPSCCDCSFCWWAPCSRNFCCSKRCNQLPPCRCLSGADQVKSQGKNSDCCCDCLCGDSVDCGRNYNNTNVGWESCSCGLGRHSCCDGCCINCGNSFDCICRDLCRCIGDLNCNLCDGVNNAHCFVNLCDCCANCDVGCFASLLDCCGNVLASGGIECCVQVCGACAQGCGNC